ncbi:RteC domain-containing protein [Aestuariivivens sediminicola]|uniref:RteC domain-containing protein n=1 Tax=Aestuariivivens sediminicola TaxID=2913560 RepID=UPI001F59B994|nr:RteC domain-containing protein [Aestuariivivens sediminicola]
MKNGWYNKIHEIIELQEFLSVIVRDEEGNAVKVSGAYNESPERTRPAETEKDFEEIYVREFGKYKTTIENINLFKEIVNKKILSYKNTYSYDKCNHDLLVLANDFIIFLESKLNLIEKGEPTETSNINKLQWYGSQIQLIELTKALIENGNIKGKQEDVFKTVQEIFNVKLNNIDQAITKFNSRNQENETKFLNSLQSALSKYIKNKLERNR